MGQAQGPGGQRISNIERLEKERGKVRAAVTKDGPYIVTGDIPLARQTIVADANGGSEGWSEGPPIEHGKTYALCRCGGSKTKPFCDGTHAKNGFDGTETASRAPYLDEAHLFDGPDMQLTDVQSLCAFARFCDPNGQVWSQVSATDDPRVKEQFLRQVNNCPSGRLRSWGKSSGAFAETELPVSIGLIEDPVEGCSGPLWLRGGITVVGADGFDYEVRNRVTLCRCGKSSNKPFCDGSHAAVKFTDD